MIVPARNALKRYAENGYYHLYNRGVAKGEIFSDPQDYAVFLSYLKQYLSPLQIQEPSKENPLQALYWYVPKNYWQEIELLAFCLMPNHFHLLTKQRQPRSIESFMRSLLIRYSQYFNKRYQRVGHVFQGVYKGALIDNEQYLWWLSRYIHRNPLENLKKEQKLSDYSYSSYPAYLGRWLAEWVKPGEILSQVKNYRTFVEGETEQEPDLLPTLEG